MKVFQDNNVLNVGVRTEFHYQNKLLAAISFFSDKDVYVRSILCIPKVPFTYMYRFFVYNIHAFTKGHYHSRNSVDFGMYQGNTNQQDKFSLLTMTQASKSKY